jgi:hypothetical protein
VTSLEGFGLSWLPMKTRLWVLAGWLLVAAACSRGGPQRVFKPDPRYARVISFAPIGVDIPITRDGHYVRLDGVVDDMSVHQAKVQREYDIDPANVRFTNAATNGRTLRVDFKGGEHVDVIWVWSGQPPPLVAASLEHERFHALFHLAPEGVPILERALAAKGLPVALTAFDDELAATIVEIASIHLGGAPLETLSGPDEVDKAIKVLKEARARVTP